MATRRSQRSAGRATSLALVIALAFGCSPTIPDDAWGTAVGAPSTTGRLSAVLINGGGRRQINYHSHLDHLRRLLRVLEAAGVESTRIAVFSGDGADPAPDLATREGELPPDFWLLPRTEAKRLRPPIEYIDSMIDEIALQPVTRCALGSKPTGAAWHAATRCSST